MRKRRIILVAMGVTVLVLGVAALLVVRFMNRNEPEVYADAREHFKYGSFGSEGRAGVPYSLWLALPSVFPEYLPDGPGEGYEKVGFLYEPGRERPIGTSYRESPIGQLGLTCAVCHVSTIRESPQASPRIVLGMPANQFNLQAYLNFLRAVGRDDRFTPDVLLPAIKRVDPDFGFADELLYRHYVIPRTKEALQDVDDDFAWMDRRPPQGPGRVDTFNPYKAIFDIDRVSDETIGTSDLPSIWNQRPRQGMQLHWDGNNTKVEERNISAAIGAGSSEASLDEAAMNRIAEWIRDLSAPRYPRPIDEAKAARGEQIYAGRCASCHSFEGDRVGKVTPIDEIGTDRERLDSFTPELVGRMNTLGTGRPWRFRNFRKTNGYANQPLDGIWLRAPYLHNGSVPDLRSLLDPPAERPRVFYRAYDVYDFDRVGFVTQGPEAERVGFRFDTGVPGNGNGGHTYGTSLSDADKDALVEYLKGE